MNKQVDKRKKKKSRTWIYILAGVIVIAAAGFYINNRRTTNAAVTQYETVPAEKGTLIATIGATGTVRSNQTAILAWQTTGTIGTIKVKAGDAVQTGDVLAVLAPDANLLQLESALVTAKDNVAQMTSADAIANARLAVTTDQTNLINAQSAVNNLQYWQNQGLIQDYYASYVIAKANLDKAQTNYDNAHVGQYINNADEATLYQALYNAKQAYDNAHYYWSLYSQPPTQRQVDEAQANLDLVTATLANDRAYVAALTGGTVPADATGANLFKLNQAKLAVQTAQANLEATTLTAPFKGIITEVDGMVGDQVAPATTAFRLDDLSQLKVDVQVSEVDINSVHVGQPVSLTFDAISGKTYDGKVLQVAQVGGTNQGAVDFTVTVGLTNPDVNVKPGMTAAVTVTVNQVNNVLLVPNRAVRLINNQHVVYVLLNGQPEQVNINLGASSDTQSEVVSTNLHVGDLIILNPPSNLFTRPNGGGGGGGPFGGGM